MVPHMAVHLSDLPVRPVRLHVARLGCRMTTRNHAERGQLFGWDGRTMWVEQTLEPSHAPTATIAPGTLAWDVFTGEAVTCPCEHPGCTHPLTCDADGVWVHNVTVTK